MIPAKLKNLTKEQWIEHSRNPELATAVIDIIDIKWTKLLELVGLAKEFSDTPIALHYTSADKASELAVKHKHLILELDDSSSVEESELGLFAVSRILDSINRLYHVIAVDEQYLLDRVKQMIGKYTAEQIKDYLTEYSRQNLSVITRATTGKKDFNAMREERKMFINTVYDSLKQREQRNNCK